MHEEKRTCAASCSFLYEKNKNAGIRVPLHALFAGGVLKNACGFWRFERFLCDLDDSVFLHEIFRCSHGE